MWLYFASEMVAVWLTFAILALVYMLIPDGQDSAWRLAVDTWNPDQPMEIPLLILRTVALCMVLAISLTDIFVIGAGFGVYINNRTWVEGWDVELAFKRMAQRLTKVVLILAVLLSGGLSGNARGGEEKSPAQVIKEVKAHPDFKVHTVTERVPKSKSSAGSSGWLAGMAEMLSVVFAVCAIVLLLGGIGWVLWKYRHALRLRGGIENRESIKPVARVVMGMEVTSTSLPDDIPTAAWRLWEQGRHQEALALLYRGSISRVIGLARVEIHESDTEGDCMRRVEAAGKAAFPEYFRAITGAWIRLAYAGVSPADSEIHVLCQQWPFDGRREL